jgi:hypothetical protein
MKSLMDPLWIEWQQVGVGGAVYNVIKQRKESQAGLLKSNSSI